MQWAELLYVKEETLKDTVVFLSYYKMSPQPIKTNCRFFSRYYQKKLIESSVISSVQVCSYANSNLISDM